VSLKQGGALAVATKLVKDPHDPRIWDHANKTTLTVHLIDAHVWEQITGLKPSMGEPSTIASSSSRDISDFDTDTDDQAEEPEWLPSMAGKRPAGRDPPRRLSSQQEEALRTYPAMTHQRMSAAVPLLERSGWNAIVRFFTGERGTDSGWEDVSD
jgi:hypothetical protein